MEATDKKCPLLVLISAQAEWESTKVIYKPIKIHTSPYGEFFKENFKIMEKIIQVLFFHGGWGKINAAGSTQYVIDQWRPEFIVNLGTCGGFEGKIKLHEVLIARKTIVYDIWEQMGDSVESISYFTTTIDLSCIKKPYPTPVIETTMVSADRDILSSQVPELHKKYLASAGDWESGAIAFIAKRNYTKCIILREVSDIIGKSESEVYGNYDLFKKRTGEVMKHLTDILPLWIKNILDNSRL